MVLSLMETTMPNMDSVYLKVSPYKCDKGNYIGKLPSELTNAELKGLSKSSKPKGAIRNKCLDCCNGSSGEVRKCVISNCALWAHRMGYNPHYGKK